MELMDSSFSITWEEDYTTHSCLPREHSVSRYILAKRDFHITRFQELFGREDAA
jgi:hypothetical protein